MNVDALPTTNGKHNAAGLSDDDRRQATQEPTPSAPRPSIGVPPPPTWLTEPGSKRWLHMQAALRLSIQRVSHKWTYEDWQLCFPLLCEEEPAEAGQLFDDMREFMQVTMEQRCASVLEDYQLRPRIDELFSVVSAQKNRERADEHYQGSDVWRDDLPPRTAARARTVPRLENERRRLQDELDALERQAAELQTRMQDNVRARETADNQAVRVLDDVREGFAQWDGFHEEAGS